MSDVLGEGTAGNGFELRHGEVMDHGAGCRRGFESKVDMRRAPVCHRCLLDWVDLLRGEHGRAALTEGKYHLAGEGAQSAEVTDDDAEMLKVAVPSGEGQELSERDRAGTSAALPSEQIKGPHRVLTADAIAW